MRRRTIRLNDLYSSCRPRRPQALLSPDGISSLRWQNPGIVLWWSIAFPGFGHFLLHQFFRGFLLSAWEVGINRAAHVNEAVVYSFSGRFAMATEVLEPKWAFAYAAVYLFAIWDSYVKAVEANKQYHLAKLEGAGFASAIIKPWTIAYISEKRPVAAMLCSMIFPGLGQLYNNRISLGFYGVFWWVVYLIMSNVQEAMSLLFRGRIGEATNVLNPQWLLYMPSVVFGAMYDAYMTARDHNRLFRLDQRRFFEVRYPPSPRLFERSANHLLILSTFEHSIEVEEALAVLEKMDIDRESITAVMMDNHDERTDKTAGSHPHKTTMPFEIGMACATAFCVIGISMGFVLKLGPLIWGMMAAMTGFCVGYGVMSGIQSNGFKRLFRIKNRKPELAVIIRCHESRFQDVQRILWEYRALSVGTIKD